MDIAAIVGQELKAVEFVEDFCSCDLEGPWFTLYAWPYVLLADFRWRLESRSIAMRCVRRLARKLRRLRSRKARR